MSTSLGVMTAVDGLRRRSPWVLAIVGAVAVAAFGAVERYQEPAYAADRTLLGITFGFVLPLWCYALFESLHRKEPTRALVSPLARHGADRRAATLGVLGALALTSATAGAVLGVLAALVTHSPSDGRMLADVVACAWGGAVIGAAYAGLFSAGSVFGRGGRLTALGLDWAFGSGAGVLALPFPRSSARSLLGGEPTLGMSQLTALAVLLGLTLAWTLLPVARERR
jgi:hypothetical protein